MGRAGGAAALHQPARGGRRPRALRGRPGTPGRRIGRVHRPRPLPGHELRPGRGPARLAGRARGGGPRGQREALRYLEQVALVLDVLHSGRATPSKRVVVHGDLSPGNVMISDEGQATLVDFGLSRIAARHMTARPWFTPGYAAPEIFTGEYSAATDRYAFGAIAYFTLTGRTRRPPPSSCASASARCPWSRTRGSGSAGSSWPCSRPNRATAPRPRTGSGPCGRWPRRRRGPGRRPSRATPSWQRP
ncbi:phosphotransferase [Nocardiopsis sp. ARC36]